MPTALLTGPRALPSRLAPSLPPPCRPPSPQIGPTAIPALWREQYGILDNIDLPDMYNTLLTEAQLFFRAGFNFRELAFEEARKYYKPFMIKGASELVKGLGPASFGSYGRPGIRAQLLDKRTRKLVMDFHIEGDESSTHVLNAVSPAWTCSVPFAQHVCDTMKLK